jgi:hypothetical protein
VEVELMPSEEAEMRPTATGHNSSIQCRDAHPILGTCCIQCAFQNNNGFFINAARAASLSLYSQIHPSQAPPASTASLVWLAQRRNDTSPAFACTTSYQLVKHEFRFAPLW